MKKFTFEIWHCWLQVLRLEVKLKARKRENHFSVVIVVLKLHIRRDGTGTSGSFDGICVGLTRVLLEHREAIDSCGRRRIKS